MREEGVLQPLLVTQSAVTLATECVRMILKVRPAGGGSAAAAPQRLRPWLGLQIDDIVPCR